MSQQAPVVISLGGSIVVPSGGVDTEFIRRFYELIMSHVEKGRRFVIIVGGGATAREYIGAAGKIDSSIPNDDKDWLGIHSTRLNAHLLRTVFRKVAHPRVNDNPHEFEEFANCDEAVIIGSGYRPGFSTDFDAVVLGYNLGADTVVNLSNINFVYDKDPNKFADAVKKEELTWSEYRSFIASEWTPGLHAPIDPVAAKFADEHNMRIAMIKGDNLGNLAQYLKAGEFIGTRINY